MEGGPGGLPRDADIPEFHNMMDGIAGHGRYDADDERFDEDGNFFGRGRDNFLGTVAKADE